MSQKSIPSPVAIGAISLLIILFFALGVFYWRNRSKETNATLQVQETMPQIPQTKNEPAPPTRTPAPQTEADTAPQVKTVDYVDPEMKFKVKIPIGFVEEKALGGNLYDKFFSKKYGDDLVSIVVSVSKDERKASNAKALADLKEAEKNREAIVSDVKNVTVDGVPAIQKTVGSLTEGKNPYVLGCLRATYFMKNGKSHTIEISVPGGCDAISKFESEYNTVVNSFHY